MKRFVTACAILALFAAAGTAHGQQTPQRQAVSCPAGTNAVWRSGVNIACNCALLTGDDGKRRWEFYAEPEVTSIAPDGYLAGVLRPGDAIVAVDGHLVTTAEGGQRFRAIEEGAPAELTFLRDGRLQTRSVTPAPRCEAPDQRSPREGAPREPARLDANVRLTEGYLGLGISARASVRHRAGEPPVWHFRESPVVSGLDPAGPTARAGLVVGDTLTHVNGLPITTEESGRLFGAIQPGDTVAFSYRGAGRRGVGRVVAGGRQAQDAAALTLQVARQLEAYRHAPSFSGSLDDVQVQVRGPAVIERLGDRIVVRSRDGEMVVTIHRDPAR